VGAVATFFGYLILGPILFTAGFLTGGGLCFVAVRAGLDESDTAAWVSIIAMMVGGGLIGFLAVKMLLVGTFALGAALGIAASAALKAVLWGRLFPESPHAGFVAGCIVLGTVCGLLALAVRKQMLILSTAYAGSFCFFFGIGHFAGHFPTVDDLGKVESGRFSPWAVTYLALTALLGTIGMLVQLQLASEKPASYAAADGSASRRHHGSGSTSSSDRAEWERELLASSDRIDPRDRSSPLDGDTGKFVESTETPPCVQDFAKSGPDSRKAAETGIVDVKVVVSGGEQSGPSEPWKNVSGSAIPEADGGSQATIFDIESQSNLPERRTQS
jgi:Domain of unknown function (DUF4203)